MDSYIYWSTSAPLDGRMSEVTQFRPPQLVHMHNDDAHHILLNDILMMIKHAASHSTGRQKCETQRLIRRMFASSTTITLPSVDVNPKRIRCHTISTHLVSLNAHRCRSRCNRRMQKVLETPDPINGSTNIASHSADVCWRVQQSHLEWWMCITTQITCCASKSPTERDKRERTAKMCLIFNLHHWAKMRAYTNCAERGYEP